MSIINSELRLTSLPPGAVRPAAVAGQFYPSDPGSLRAMVSQLLAGAEPGAGTPKALIAPHAGYVYSGPVAASAYAALAQIRGRIRRVVLLGPAHRLGFQGLALPSTTHFETPMGAVAIDTAEARRLLALPGVQVMDEAHAREHSLEVHLPFLQVLLPEFRLVPLVVGDAAPKMVARVLEAAWGGDETLVIVSSDLSHYHDYQTARRLDEESSRAIENLELEQLGPGQACGCMPLRGLLQVARRRKLAVHRLDLRNSGDTAGPRDRVVGYGAWKVEALPGEGARDDRATLLSVARASIEAGLEGSVLNISPADYTPALREPRAAFVTLTVAGELRGCMGTTEPEQALVTCVGNSAFNAAFRDPRFSPLTRAEHGRVTVSISVLGIAEAISFQCEEELLAHLRPGVDGLIIEAGSRRATFLPSVWESLPRPAAFLEQLKKKAGIPAAVIPARAWRYTTQSFSGKAAQ